MYRPTAPPLLDLEPRAAHTERTEKEKKSTVRKKENILKGKTRREEGRVEA